MPVRRPLLALVAALAVAAGALSAGAPASAASGGRDHPPGYVPAPVAWSDCSDTYGSHFECGRVAVPLDWGRPQGTKILLAVTRYAHTATPYQGVMLVNPGGPGGSGTGLASLKDFVPNGGGDGYDWIGFDPRGVGDSTPRLSCIPDYGAGVRPPYEPTTRTIEHAWLKRSIAYAHACAKNDPILQHMTTVDAAKDMDAIRQALRQKRINYYGFSYGTYLGQVYSTLFPTHVRRMVFDGTVDPRRVWYPANLDQDIAFEKTEHIWFGWLAKYDSVYHLGTTRAQVAAQYQRAKAQLTKHPVGAVGGSEWEDIMLYAGYYQSVWTDIAAVFSGWAVHHDPAALQKGYDDWIEASDDNGYAVYAAVECTDAKWPRSYASYRADQWATYEKTPFYTWGNAWFNAPCLFWPVKAKTPVRVDGSKVQSVLMINETLDAATPYSGSLEVRKRYPGARLIAEPGGTTHAGSLYGDACVDDAIAAYLANGTLPARKPGGGADKYCAPLPQPVPTAAGASAKAMTGADRLGPLVRQRLKAAAAIGS